MAEQPTVILAEIESDHRSQWARDRVPHRVTITLMTSYLLTGRPFHFFLCELTVLLLWSVGSVCHVTHWDLWRIKHPKELLNPCLLHCCNNVLIVCAQGMCVCCNLLACNISESYQRLFALNFSPVCLCGEVCQRWLGNRKRWRQRGYHPPAALVISREPQL